MVNVRFSLGKPIDFHLFKMSCLTCFVFSCVYCFFLKRWNYIKIFVLHEEAVFPPKLFFSQIDVININLSNSSSRQNRSCLWKRICLSENNVSKHAVEFLRRRGRGELLGLQPPRPHPNFLLSNNVLKEILFPLQFLNEELNSFYSYKKHRFGLL